MAAISSISSVEKPAISRNLRARRMAAASSSPRAPRKLKSPSTVRWNSSARLRRSSSPSVTVRSQFELELERHFAGRLEVEGGASGALEGLDLAHEDAVHAPPGPIGHILGVEHKVLLLATGRHRADVLEALLEGDAVEACVASEGF